MKSACESCGLKFEREPGFYLGSIYINYGLTAFITTAAYFTLFFSQTLSDTARLVLLATFCLLFPLWFFRYARALWLALDQFYDPASSNEPPKSS